jgi:hypothetical protein
MRGGTNGRSIKHDQKCYRKRNRRNEVGTKETDRQTQLNLMRHSVALTNTGGTK